MNVIYIIFLLPLQLNDYELCIASDLINPQSLDIDWSCIGGLDSTVADIKESVLLPFIYRKHVSKLVRPPKGYCIIMQLSHCQTSITSYQLSTFVLHKYNTIILIHVYILLIFLGEYILQIMTHQNYDSSLIPKPHRCITAWSTGMW